MLTFEQLGIWQGVKACTEAIDAGCEDVKAFFRRGKCYRHLGDVDKARKVWYCFMGPFALLLLLKMIW